mmetsp:Transcript_39648/g.105564  ORF Transcript_39648/g.105564 Transcript_39648/m.105564 type:complete len:311 (-) Transcript_39648:1261-2193(-)
MAEAKPIPNQDIVHGRKPSMKKMRVDTLLAGGIAGAAARTLTAPLDRVKILMQTQRISSAKHSSVVVADKYTSLTQALIKVAKDEGIKGYWRGNLANCIRVVPYSATQFVTFEQLRHIGVVSFLPTIMERLTCGAMAGMAATFVTHPLDVIRLRLAVDPELRGIFDSFRSLWREGQFIALYKGLGPTLASLAPFVAINFATYDTLKSSFLQPDKRPDPVLSLLLGAAAGLIAQSACYPLDTIRRRMQMKGRHYDNTWHAFCTILRQEGIQALYRGIAANTLKVRNIEISTRFKSQSLTGCSEQRDSIYGF